MRYLTVTAEGSRGEYEPTGSSEICTTNDTLEEIANRELTVLKGDALQIAEDGEADSDEPEEVDEETVLEFYGVDYIGESAACIATGEESVTLIITEDNPAFHWDFDVSEDWAESQWEQFQDLIYPPS